MRIVAGKHRGLVLNTFDVDNIRPTIDRVRENIFNKIQFGVSGSCVLDLFGGTGAVSLEFVSRGAREVIIVDNNRNSTNIIKQNFAKAKEKPNLIEKDYQDALKYLSSLNKKFDYIFLDPPYAENFGEDAMSLIVKYNMLVDDGLIIYEHLVDKQYSLPNELEEVGTKKYGTVIVSYIGWAE